MKVLSGCSVLRPQAQVAQRRKGELEKVVSRNRDVARDVRDARQGTGKNKVFNEVIETARSAALILDQQPPSFPRG